MPEASLKILGIQLSFYLPISLSVFRVSVKTQTLKIQLNRIKLPNIRHFRRTRVSSVPSDSGLDRSKSLRVGQIETQLTLHERGV